MVKKFGMKITIADNVLLLIKNITAQEPEIITVPFASTRLGLAEILGKTPANISRAAKNLMEKGLIEEYKANVNGYKRRVITYFLTAKGFKQKNELEKKIGSNDILYKDKDGAVLKIKISEIDKYYGIRTTMAEKFESVNEDGWLLYEVLDKTRKKSLALGLKNYVNFTNELPTIEYFFGRREELRTIRRWIGSKKTKIIVIYGFAGIGKTTLAGELIYNYNAKTNTFWKGIHDWNELRDILQSFSDFLFKMNRVMLKNYLDSNQRIKLNEINHIIEMELKDIKALLVFDDCHQANEKIIQFLTILKEIVRRCKNITILLLSRDELPFYDIRDVVSQKPIAEMHLGDLDEESAIKLLISRKIDESKFKEIVEITQGFPLALNFIQVPKYRKLDKNLIMGDVNNFLYRQVFMKLKSDEKKLLKALSVYRNPISQEALMYEEKIKYEPLENLVKKSLLNQNLKNEYSMHDVVQEFIYSQLGPIERKKYHTLAAEFYEKIDDDFSLRESMYHYLKTGKFVNVSELLVENGEDLIKKGHCENLNIILEELKEKDVPKQFLAKILLIKAKIKTLLGEWDDALTLFIRVIDEEIEASKIQSEAYRGIGYIWTERGEWDKALENYKNSSKISEILDDKEGLAEVYRLLGNIYWKISEYNESLKYLNKSLEIAEEIENTLLIGKVYGEIGLIHSDKNYHEEAHKYLEKSLKLLEKSSCITEMGRAMNGLGTLCYDLSNYHKAIEYFEKCIKNSEKSGNIETMGYGLLNLGGCYIKIEELEKANEYCNHALTIFEKLENRRMVASGFLEFGRICRLQKEWDKSMKHFIKSLRIFENINVPYYLAQVQYEMGKLYKDMGESNKAKLHFHNGLKIAKEKNIDYFIEKIEKQL